MGGWGAGGEETAGPATLSFTAARSSGLRALGLRLGERAGGGPAPPPRRACSINAARSHHRCSLLLPVQQTATAFGAAPAAS